MKARNFLILFCKMPIYLYQWTIRPFVGSSCRFYPSCSDYGLLALKKHGPLKGSYLTIKRICKCNPFCEGGVDYP
ncbi:MAG: membrane protein insertion efficiency factor YidD [Chlamydiae bacterium]|nr:membrane protein insertion efficiency factor YidD [Chlamydiota bacterium]